MIRERAFGWVDPVAAAAAAVGSRTIDFHTRTGLNACTLSIIFHLLMNTSSSSPPQPPSNEDHESLLLESPSPPAAATATDLEEPCEIQTHMRSFLKQHTAYDVLPVSYRLIVFDTRLLVKKALGALVQNGNFIIETREREGRKATLGSNAMYDRDRLGTFMVKRYTPIRRHVNGLRFRSPYSILLSSHVSRGCSTRYRKIRDWSSTRP